jgi:hypothetical protein
MRHQTISTLLAIISCVTLADPVAAAERSASGVRELRRQVDVALRAEATAKTTDQRRAAVRALVDLVQKIDSAAAVPAADRQRERNRVRTRLAAVHRELERPGAANPAAVNNRPPLLAQVAPAPAGGPANPAAPADHGDDLAELIRQTIAPHTWDVNGGNGVIVYFPARRVLVVRQQAEVHWGLADVIGQLRRN